ncbi:MAG: ATP synthase F1 subunit delta [Bdellovibrionales bacterium]|nr:ATP synthase F1 subunit delta [Bdellovibrionales bacterium]
MKKSSELATRYAKALYKLASDAGEIEKTMEELLEVRQVFQTEPDIVAFITSPLVSNDKKESVINDGLNGNKLSSNTKNFLKLLAKKDRFQVLPDIFDAFQALIDDESGVVRGVVKSTSALESDIKSKIESKISSVTGKKVMLDYEVSSDLVGGLQAQVGTYTFDDSLISHLNRLNEELNRRSL